MTADSVQPVGRVSRHMPGGYRLAAVAGLALLVVGCTWYWQHGTNDRAAMRLLRSAAPEDRKRGAWLAASEDAPRAMEFIAAGLPKEADADAREGFVHALGRSADRRHFDAVWGLAHNDPEPRVRLAAWMAAARVDADRFRALADPVSQADSAWDEIAWAQGWLEAGDVRGVVTLLLWAERGDQAQRRTAAQALRRRVAPLLESIGRWPLSVSTREGDPWPAELVADVRRRCDGLDLQALTDDARPHLAASARVLRNVGRLLSARDRLGWLMGR